jgi:hypothetical protein
MNGAVSKLARCAIYTRKSTEHNLGLSFNSLDAQREACEAYIKSQVAEGWRLVPHGGGRQTGPQGAKVIAIYVVEQGKPLSSSQKCGARSWLGL